MQGRFGAQLVVVLIAAGLGACSLNTRSAPPTAMATAGVSLPPDRVQVDAFEASRRFSFTIEQTVQIILDSTDDPATRRRAMLWRMNGVNAAQDAAFRFDPFVSVLDLYALSEQQRRFFTDGAGRGHFGSLQPFVVARVNETHAALREYLDRALPAARADSIARELDAWADRHPIEDELFGRATVTSVAARVIKTDETSLFAAVGDVQSRLRSLDGRVAVLQQSIAKQVGWQAEYLAGEAFGSSKVDSLLGATTKLVGAVDRISLVAEGAPGLVRGERAAVMARVSEERKAVLAGVKEERIAVLAALDQQRELVFQELNRQRAAIMKESEQLGTRLMDRSFQRLDGLVDHLVWRIALLIVLPLAVGVVILAIAIFAVFWPRTRVVVR
jgi:hypothetical protein